MGDIPYEKIKWENEREFQKNNLDYFSSLKPWKDKWNAFSMRKGASDEDENSKRIMQIYS